MRTTIDSAGRLVVPKALRDALGLVPGQTLDISARDGRLEIDVAPTPMTLRRGRHGVVAVPDDTLPVLTVDQVRAALEQTRR